MTNLSLSIKIKAKNGKKEEGHKKQLVVGDSFC